MLKHSLRKYMFKCSNNILFLNKSTIYETRKMNEIQEILNILVVQKKWLIGRQQLPNYNSEQE